MSATASISQRAIACEPDLIEQVEAVGRGDFDFSKVELEDLIMMKHVATALYLHADPWQKLARYNDLLLVEDALFVRLAG